MDAAGNSLTAISRSLRKIWITRRSQENLCFYISVLSFYVINTITRKECNLYRLAGKATAKFTYTFVYLGR